MEKNYKLCSIYKANVDYVCFECSTNYYCESYFKMVHGEKENIAHRKFEVGCFIAAKILCQEHQTIPYNIFCLTENGNKNII